MFSSLNINDLDTHCDPYYDFIMRVLNFKEDLDYKLPGYLQSKALHVCFDKDSSYLFESHPLLLRAILHDPDNSKDHGCLYQKKSVCIRSVEFFKALEEVFCLKIEFTENTDNVNPIDRFFSNILDRYSSHLRPDVTHRLADARNGKTDIHEMRKKEFVFFTQRLVDEIHIHRREMDKEAQYRIDTLEKRVIQSRDGFTLNYFIGGDRKKPPLILVNAYGMSHEIWKWLIRHFSEKFKIVTWQTRGYDETDGNLSLRGIDHASDLEHIIREEGIEKADFVCWCSGLKIVMEYYRLHQDTFRTLSIVTGYFEPLDKNNPLRTPFDSTIGRLSQMIVHNPKLVHLLKDTLMEKAFHFRYSKHIADGFENAIPHDVLEQILGGINEHTKRLVIRPFLNGNTFINYARMTVDLQEHDISDLLAASTVPTLIIGAENDIISHPMSSEMAAKRLLHSHYVSLKNASHWCLWDNHEEVNSLIEGHIVKH